MSIVVIVISIITICIIIITIFTSNDDGKYGDDNNANSNDTNNDDHNTHLPNNDSHTDNELNCPITEEEIERAIRTLKNNKSSGCDKIMNEHIKETFPLMKHIYIKLFNILFDRAIVPEQWTIGIINPIYKNKGDSTKPENYRPITLLSCFGKLFTKILNSRIEAFTEKHDIIDNCQAGFRKGYSTTDNMFVLHSLIQILNNDKKKLFCAFIDLKQAFDKVWREGLWGKLLNINITGKCYEFIHNMYSNIKSCVKVNSSISNYFPSNIGVRQGENLSPILFSIFLNDLNTYFINSGNVDGLQYQEQNLDDNIVTYIKLFILLYADDTVLLCDSELDLQNALDEYERYCSQWKLTVNTSKTKVLVFSKGRNKNYNFTYLSQKLEVVKEYKYLGIFFSRSGSFYTAKKHIANQATRAMYSIIKKSRSLSLPIDMQIELFNKIVKPILLYGCEIWGYGNIEVIERVQLKFLKILLNIKSSTPNYMVYGETGVLPVCIDINTRIITFWGKLIHPECPKLGPSIYNIMLNYFKHNNNKNSFHWISNIKTILTNTGQSGIWDLQSFPNLKWLKSSIQQRLKDVFLSNWYSSIQNSSKSINYRIFKHNFGFESYLNGIPIQYARYLIKFRLRNHKLPVEKGDWAKVPLHLRKCNICLQDIGDEFHYLFVCKGFNIQRKTFLKKDYISHPSTYKYDFLMNTNNSVELIKLCKFIKTIMHTFK